MLDTEEKLRAAADWSHRLNKIWRAKPTRSLVLYHGMVLAKKTTRTELAFLTRAQIGAFFGPDFEPLFLGSSAGVFYFACDLSDSRVKTPDLGADLAFVPTMTALHALSEMDKFILSSALSLVYWRRRSVSCGACGSAMHTDSGGFKRFCARCRQRYTPQVDPVVVMLIYKDDRCLLGQNLSRHTTKRYCCISGHLNQSESVENAVKREAMEEVGVEVHNIQYKYSQPWPFPHKLMLGFWAEALTENISVDKSELNDAKWFTLQEVQSALANENPRLTLRSPVTIANRLMRDWVAMRLAAKRD